MPVPTGTNSSTTSNERRAGTVRYSERNTSWIVCTLGAVGVEEQVMNIAHGTRTALRHQHAGMASAHMSRRMESQDETMHNIYSFHDCLQIVLEFEPCTRTDVR
jgi:hypothetical protein